MPRQPASVKPVDPFEVVHACVPLSGLHFNCDGISSLTLKSPFRRASQDSSSGRQSSDFVADAADFLLDDARASDARPAELASPAVSAAKQQNTAGTRYCSGDGLPWHLICSAPSPFHQFNIHSSSRLQVLKLNPLAQTLPLWRDCDSGRHVVQHLRRPRSATPPRLPSVHDAGTARPVEYRIVSECCSWPAASRYRCARLGSRSIQKHSRQRRSERLAESRIRAIRFSRIVKRSPPDTGILENALQRISFPL